MSISIGLGAREDAWCIARMSARLIESGLPASWNEPRIRHCVDHPDWIVLTARQAQRLVGFAIMEFRDEHAHLGLLAVHAAYRRHGIATRLVEWLESSARTAGIFCVHLELRAGNQGALAFYRKLGFNEIGVRPRYYAGREDAIRMGHDLTVVGASR